MLSRIFGSRTRFLRRLGHPCFFSSAAKPQQPSTLEKDTNSTDLDKLANELVSELEGEEEDDQDQEENENKKQQVDKKLRRNLFPEARNALKAYIQERGLDAKTMTFQKWSEAAWDLGLPLQPYVCCKRVTGKVTIALKASCYCDDPACHDPSSPKTGYLRCKAGKEWNKDDSIRLHRALSDQNKDPKLLSHPEWNNIADDLKLGRTGMCCANHVLKWPLKKSRCSFYSNLDTRPWTEAENQLLRQSIDNLGNEWAITAVQLRRTVYECKRQWGRIQTSGKWRKDEVERLHEALKIYKPNQCVMIAKHVGTRSAWQCQFRVVNEELQRIEWKKEWDPLLLNAVQLHGKNWSKVIQHLREEHNIDNLTNKKVKVRFECLQYKQFSWDQKLDAHLQEAVSQFGTKNWKAVAEYVTGDRMLCSNCKKWYELKFDPKYNRAPWTENEKKRLKEIMDSIKKDEINARYDWKDIVAKLGTQRHPYSVRMQCAALKISMEH